MFWSRRQQKLDLEALTDEVAALKRKVSTMEATFDDTIEQLRRAWRNNARTVNRLREIEASSPQEEGAEAATAPNLDPISSRILARRNRIAGGGTQ